MHTVYVYMCIDSMCVHAYSVCVHVYSVFMCIVSVCTCVQCMCICVYLCIVCVDMCTCRPAEGGERACNSHRPFTDGKMLVVTNFRAIFEWQHPAGLGRRALPQPYKEHR